MREEDLFILRERVLGLTKPSPIADLQIEHFPVEQSQIQHLTETTEHCHWQIEDLQIESLERTHIQIEHVPLQMFKEMEITTS